MKKWVKPTIESIAKPIETVFIWNSGQPGNKPWENDQPTQRVFLTRIKNLFTPEKEVIA